MRGKIEKKRLSGSVVVNANMTSVRLAYKLIDSSS